MGGVQQSTIFFFAGLANSKMSIGKSSEVICLLVSVCIHSLLAQTFPYVSFLEQTLANHSYVNFSLVGDDDSGSDSVRCHTDLSTCCSRTDGSHRGDWYFPDGDKLLFSGSGNIYEHRTSFGVDLRHINGGNDGISGIYRCDIPTLAVHEDDDTSVRDVVYVGLYHGGGEYQNFIIPLSTLLWFFEGDVTTSIIDFNYDGSEPIPKFTLSCTSTGGPATTVTWTRDSNTITKGNVTVLDDPVTAQYTHTLNVTGWFYGVYTCNVSNNKPSKNSSILRVKGKVKITIALIYDNYSFNEMKLHHLRLISY